jgi:hypothetical protein
LTTEPDASGNGNDGTYFRDPEFTTGLVVGNGALLIAGVGGVNTIDVPDLTLSWLNAWTFELWLNIPSSIGSGSESLVIAADPFASPDRSIIDIHAQLGVVTVEDQIGTVWQSVGSSLSTNAIHHVVVTYDGASAVLLYVDANLISWATTGTHFIGWQAPSQVVIAANTAVGVYDECAIYPSVLSPTRISAHYAAASVSFAAYTAAVLADGPNVYYHFGSQVTGWILGEIPIA